MPDTFAEEELVTDIKVGAGMSYLFPKDSIHLAAMIRQLLFCHNSYGLRYSFRHPLDVTVSATVYSGIDRSTLKYFYTLYAKFVASKIVIITDSCVVKGRPEL